MAAFLPWAQMKNAHVIVDFFTHQRFARCAPRARPHRRDHPHGANFVIAWRSFAGAWERERRDHDVARLAAVVVTTPRSARASSCSA